jgi:hypothetical protein
VGDGTGLAEALLQFERFRVLGVHEPPAEVVIELGEVRAGGAVRDGTLTTAEVCDLFDRDLVDGVVFLDFTCGTTPGRGHDEERLVRVSRRS